MVVELVDREVERLADRDTHSWDGFRESKITRLMNEDGSDRRRWTTEL